MLRPATSTKWSRGLARQRVCHRGRRHRRAVSTPTGSGHAEADPSAEEGRGIQLIRALVDSVHFRPRAESGTIVHLEKELQYVDGSPLQKLVERSAESAEIDLGRPSRPFASARRSSTPNVAPVGWGTSAATRRSPPGMSARIGVVTFPGLAGRPRRRCARCASPGPSRSPLWHGDHDLQRRRRRRPAGRLLLRRLPARRRDRPVLAGHDRDRRRGRGTGLPVLGICNGFQVLCEAHLLPGALIRNAGLHFICRDQRLRVENADTAWTSELRRRASRSSSRSRTARAATSPTTHDPRPSSRARAASSSATSAATPTAAAATSPASATTRGNVVGLMPHPEHADRGR